METQEGGLAGIIAEEDVFRIANKIFDKITESEDSHPKYKAALQCLLMNHFRDPKKDISLIFEAGYEANLIEKIRKNEYVYCFECLERQFPVITSKKKIKNTIEAKFILNLDELSIEYLLNGRKKQSKPKLSIGNPEYLGLFMIKRLDGQYISASGVSILKLSPNGEFELRGKKYYSNLSHTGEKILAFYVKENVYFFDLDGNRVKNIITEDYIPQVSSRIFSNLNGRMRINDHYYKALTLLMEKMIDGEKNELTIVLEAEYEKDIVPTYNKRRKRYQYKFNYVGRRFTLIETKEYCKDPIKVKLSLNLDKLVINYKWKGEKITREESLKLDDFHELGKLNKNYKKASGFAKRRDVVKNRIRLWGDPIYLRRDYGFGEVIIFFKDGKTYCFDLEGNYLEHSRTLQESWNDRMSAKMEPIATKVPDLNEKGYIEKKEDEFIEFWKENNGLFKSRGLELILYERQEFPVDKYGRIGKKHYVIIDGKTKGIPNVNARKKDPNGKKVEKAILEVKGPVVNIYANGMKINAHDYGPLGFLCRTEEMNTCLISIKELDFTKCTVDVYSGNFVYRFHSDDLYEKIENENYKREALLIHRVNGCSSFKLITDNGFKEEIDYIKKFQKMNIKREYEWFFTYF